MLQRISNLGLLIVLSAQSILIKGNGYASFAKGNVRFDENGNVSIKGFIEATAGKGGDVTVEGRMTAAGIEISPTSIESISNLSTPQSEQIASSVQDTAINDVAYAQILGIQPTFSGYCALKS